MKYTVFILFIFSLSCTSAPKHARIEVFWTDFQKAVGENNRAAVADMMLFPLKGTEFMGSNFNENGLSREQFFEQYETIFDEKTRQTIVAMPAEKLVKFVSQKDAALEKIGIPPKTEVYNLTISSIFDEGLETQTESSIGFYFIKEKEVFKLSFLLMAG